MKVKLKKALDDFARVARCKHENTKPEGKGQRCLSCKAVIHYGDLN